MLPPRRPNHGRRDARVAAATSPAALHRCRGTADDDADDGTAADHDEDDGTAADHDEDDGTAADDKDDGTAAISGAAGIAGGEVHGASRDQMIAVIERLTNGEAGRWINLDVLERALKDQGFARPPGSPRLVTRLRALKKDVEIDAHGRVRLARDAGAA